MCLLGVRARSLGLPPPFFLFSTMENKVEYERNLAKLLRKLIDDDSPYIREQYASVVAPFRDLPDYLIGKHSVSPSVPQSEEPSAPMDVADPPSEASMDSAESSSVSDSSESEQYTLVGKGKRRKGKSSKATKAKKAVAARNTPPPPVSSRPISPVASTTPAAAPVSRPDSPMATAPASSKKLKSPPPIYIQDKSKWTDVSKMCAERQIQYTSARATQQGIKVTVPTSTDYRELVKNLRGRHVAFHTYSLPEEKPTRVVIRRIPKEIPTQDILEDLTSQSIPVSAVHRLHKARGGDEYDMVLVICDPVEGHHPIFKVRSVCSLTGISIEKPHRPNIIGQCHGCQLYGHSQKFCYAPRRCVKCLGAHATEDCPRPKDRSLCTEPPSCVLCGQSGHPANYRGCPKAPKQFKGKLAKRASARQQRESPSVKIPSAQLPERLSPQRPSPWNSLNHQRAFPALGSPKAPPMPGLLDVPIPCPAPTPVAATVVSPLPSPPGPAGPGVGVVKESSFDTLIRFQVFVSPEADRLAAELRLAKDLVQINEIFDRYPRITAALKTLSK